MAASAQAILSSVHQLEPWIWAALRSLVEVESPSSAAHAVNAAGANVRRLADDIPHVVTVHPQVGFGDVLEMRFGVEGDARKPVLLLGHLDTVWPIGTIASMPWREADRRFWGPGVLDMKAGVVMALTALKALKANGIERSVTLLLNSEEEIGSPVSRPITERLALESESVFVLEPAQGLAYKTARKGVGQYNLHVTGVASHAGVDFERGHSAIREIARLVEKVFNFTDPARKRTVNVGKISGGTQSNVIAAEASAEVDVRIATSEDGVVVDNLFRSLRCTDPHCLLSISGGINRPPMERTEGTVILFERARKCAAELGFVLDEASTGGGSDGNFTSALGVPTLDGMGAVGDGAHAAHESVVIEHIVPRTALLAMMIAGS